ncbi:MAG: DUF3343 domain-containing protein [Clostridia bacterium]|nr:DUF3343 domain-containing protein [Clostridia bacterium]
MKKAIIVFRSKTQVFEFMQTLAFYGVKAVITSAPKEAKIGCSLAAETSFENVYSVKKALSEGNYDGFVGIFAAEKNGGRTSVYRVS